MSDRTAEEKRHGPWLLAASLLVAVAIVAVLLWVLLPSFFSPGPPPWKTEVVFQANGVALAGGPSHRIGSWFTWYTKNCWSTGCGAVQQSTHGEVNFTGCASSPCLGEVEVYTPSHWQNLTQGGNSTPLWCGPSINPYGPPTSCIPRASGSANFTIAWQYTSQNNGVGNNTFVFSVWTNESAQVSGHVVLGYYS